MENRYFHFDNYATVSVFNAILHKDAYEKSSQDPGSRVHVAQATHWCTGQRDL